MPGYQQQSGAYSLSNTEAVSNVQHWTLDTYCKTYTKHIALHKERKYKCIHYHNLSLPLPRNEPVTLLFSTFADQPTVNKAHLSLNCWHLCLCHYCPIRSVLKFFPVAPYNLWLTWRARDRRWSDFQSAGEKNWRCIHAWVWEILWPSHFSERMKHSRMTFYFLGLLESLKFCPTVHPFTCSNK